MYVISRWLLKLSVVVGLVSLFPVLVLAWPWSAVFMLGIVHANAARLKARFLTTLGSARFADDRDLKKAGMLDATAGLILGRVKTRPNWGEAMRCLFRKAKGPREACEQFWDLFNRDRWRVVRAHQAIHTAVFAPSGSGKGVSCIIPFLLDCQENCVVVDFKGELAKNSAEHRKSAFGHRIVLLDPFHVVTDKPDCFNPLDCIDGDDPLALDHCNALAKALVVRSPDEKEPHWSDSAEAWISAMLSMVVRFGDHDGDRSLQTVQDLLSSPERIEMSLKAMQESDAWDGMLARMGGALCHSVDREKSSILSTVSRHLRFLNTPAIASCTQKSSFDLAALTKAKMTTYLIIPVEHMRAASPLLRMWIGSFLMAVVRGGLRNQDNIHFVIDEAASLGNLELIEDAVEKFRGYSVRLQLYYQSLGQLKKCFPNGQEQTLLSNTSQVYFGVNDTATAELVSARLGEGTIIVNSGGTSAGSSWQNSMGAQSQQSSGESFTSSNNWQLQARKLLKPEEIIALHPRVAITFTPGVPPVCSTLLRYYEEPQLGRPPGWLANIFKASRTCGASLLLLVVILGFAVAASMALYRSSAW